MKYKIKFISFLIFFRTITGFSGEFQAIKQINKQYQIKICNAIFIAEGKNKTRRPYGIKSIKTNSPREVCLNTISKNYLRWQKSNKTNDFIAFLGEKYAPITDKEDKTHLNQFWIRNVKKLMDNPPEIK